VFSVRPDTDFIKLCKAYDTEFLLTQLSLGEKRRALWVDHPEWFWPDGRHPNKEAHEQLYIFLKQTVDGIIKN
jgi:hypothetical protein